jgi:hypothetical protein
MQSRSDGDKSMAKRTVSFTVTFDSDTIVAVSKKKEDLNKPKQGIQFIYGRIKFERLKTVAI